MKERHKVNIVWIPMGAAHSIFNEAAIDPLKAVSDAGAMQGRAVVEQSVQELTAVHGVPEAQRHIGQAYGIRGMERPRRWGGSKGRQEAVGVPVGEEARFDGHRFGIVGLLLV